LEQIEGCHLTFDVFSIFQKLPASSYVNWVVGGKLAC